MTKKIAVESIKELDTDNFLQYTGYKVFIGPIYDVFVPVKNIWPLSPESQSVNTY